MKLFKDLTIEEEKEFKDWARANYVPYSEIQGIWHPRSTSRMCPNEQGS